MKWQWVSGSGAYPQQPLGGEGGVVLRPPSLWIPSPFQEIEYGTLAIPPTQLKGGRNSIRPGYRHLFCWEAIYQGGGGFIGCNTPPFPGVPFRKGMGQVIECLSGGFWWGALPRAYSGSRTCDCA